MGHSVSFIRKLINIFILFLLVTTVYAQQGAKATVSGSVKDGQGKPIEFATVYVEETEKGTQSDIEGNFVLSLPYGKYTIRVQYMGYETYEEVINIERSRPMTLNIVLEESRYRLDEVVIESKSGVQRVNETAYNVVALDARVQHNLSANLSGILNKISGVRIRETGGVGSDMQIMMDGFSGKHVKVFIDGVPQTGMGRSFSLNNIPMNYAERVEVYKGVVPVEFGTDAIGGVINIVTKAGSNKRWYLDASYSIGSFNTHKSSVNFGQTFNNGFTYEISAFQNYSDNSYYIDTPVKEFLPNGSSSTNRDLIERVKRFHDNYHNEAIIAKAGIVGKPWADRLMFGLNYSQVYMDIQNGVRQDIVFGGKYRDGRSIMPSLEYSKRNIFTDGLDINLNANFNKNLTHNVDTSAYEFNWRGEKRLRASGVLGEHSYQHTRSEDTNLNGTATARYRINRYNSLTVNSIYSKFSRSNQSLLTPDSEPNPIPKETVKSVTGASYQLRPSEKWNASVFGKYYFQNASGPVPTSSNLDEYVKDTRKTSTTGYGVAGTYFILSNLQAKLSYEKVYRLPTNNEMFGDEDLESGDIEIRPENSDNINFNLSFEESLGNHSLYLEGGLVYRDIKDYIQRNITGLGSGKFGATYINHGKVLTKGLTLTARYGFSNWLSVGGNYSEINARDNVETFITGSPNGAYGARMPNVPYRFANADVTFYYHDLWSKGNLLTFTYDNFFVNSFPLYSEAFGSEAKAVVPTQFSHNVSLSYSINNGRYNISLECQNLTDEKLYDNFSLQKAGRAFYGKFRISL